VLRQLAAAAHQSLQEYLRSRLIEEAAQPTLEEGLTRAGWSLPRICDHEGRRRGAGRTWPLSRPRAISSRHVLAQPDAEGADVVEPSAEGGGQSAAAFVTNNRQFGEMVRHDGTDLAPRIAVVNLKHVG
jgi:hypothetical protein